MSAIVFVVVVCLRLQSSSICDLFAIVTLFLLAIVEYMWRHATVFAVFGGTI